MPEDRIMKRTSSNRGSTKGIHTSVKVILIISPIVLNVLQEVESIVVHSLNAYNWYIALVM